MSDLSAFNATYSSGQSKPANFMNNIYLIQYLSESKGNDEKRFLDFFGEILSSGCWDNARFSLCRGKILAGHPKSKVKSWKYLFELFSSILAWSCWKGLYLTSGYAGKTLTKVIVAVTKVTFWLSWLKSRKKTQRVATSVRARTGIWRKMWETWRRYSRA